MHICLGVDTTMFSPIWASAFTSCVVTFCITRRLIFSTIVYAGKRSRRDRIRDQARDILFELGRRILRMSGERVDDGFAVVRTI